MSAAPDLGPTARFELGKGQVKTARLDYVMLSPDLVRHDPVWRVWSPDTMGDGTLRDALRLASDHFPVTLDLAIGS